MSTLIAPLGSVIGYLGAAAATESFFERLLCPERFYNDANPVVLLKLAFCLPMSGPLHGAALAALDTFRKNGLYLGMRRGHMLGTTFYQDKRVKYFHLNGPTTEQRETPKDSRNGFWVQVLREIRCQNCDTRLPRTTLEATLGAPAMYQTPPFRAMQLVHRLRLHYARDIDEAGQGVVEVTEASVTWRTALGTLFSEASSILVAIIATAAETFKCNWLTGFMLVPLFLKLLALLASVRRQSILEVDKMSHKHEAFKDELYEIEDTENGFAIVQGPASVVLQFWRHYGHPKRDNGAAGRRDRMREILSICLIYLFILYFPIGLISALWMPSNAQLLWLGFQVYAIFMMHLMRIFGWDNCGRTEARVARHLEQNRRVWLYRPGGPGIVASLETTYFSSAYRAKQEVKSIARAHFQATHNCPDNRPKDSLRRTMSDKGIQYTM